MNRRPRVNNQIRAGEVRVIDEAGTSLGVMDLQGALQIARERGLDLIQVTEKVEPPVCKIMDYGKYLYQLRKKERSVKPAGGELKGIRLTLGISQHDLTVRASQTEKFLKGGDKVRIEMKLRGREKALGKFAGEKIEIFLKILENIMPYKVERELKREPGGFSMIISK